MLGRRTVRYPKNSDTDATTAGPAICIMHSRTFEMLTPSTGDQRYAYSTSGPGFQSLTEHLLPSLHVPTYKSVSFNGSSSAFPALASLQPSGTYITVLHS